MNLNKHKILPAIEVITGTILLIREMYQMTYLPSTNDHLYGGLVDFVKYKENTYPFMFLWTLLLINGIMSWMNGNKKWLPNTILVSVAISIVLIAMLIW